MLATYGPNALRSAQRLSGLRLLLKQFQSPITLISASPIVLVIRTSGPFYTSKPGKTLLLATLWSMR